MLQCFDTFRGFLHKLYAATMDGNGREDTYNFSHDDWGVAKEAGHRAQGGSAPPPIQTRWRRPCLIVPVTMSAISAYILQVKANDPSVISGYLSMSIDSRTWNRRWFSVHSDFVLYSFKAHQVCAVSLWTQARSGGLRKAKPFSGKIPHDCLGCGNSHADSRGKYH